MKSRFFALLLVLAMAATMLTGCDLFTSGGGNANNSETGGSSEAGGSTDIQITDKYTFKDPTDIEFEKRYVLYADANSVFVSSAADYGMTSAWTIAYGNAEDTTVGVYSFMIADTEENAQKIVDLYESQGQALSVAEEDPCVLYGYTDGETFDATIVMMQSMGAISETTLSAYIDWYCSNTGSTLK